MRRRSSLVNPLNDAACFAVASGAFDRVAVFINSPHRRACASRQTDQLYLADFRMTVTAGLSRWDDLALVKLTEMIAKKVIGGDAHTLVQAFFKMGALVPSHSHPGEQVVY